MIPDSITVVYNDEVPLSPRTGQTGLRITATPVASVAALLPGELGDIMSFVVKGDYDVQFKFVSSTAGRADDASELVWAKTKELFLVPAKLAYISVISPDGDSVVIINCHARGT